MATSGKLAPIAVVTSIPLPGTLPNTIADCLAVEGGDVLELVGRVSAGSGDVVLLRWFPDLGASGEWNVWVGTKPIPVAAGGAVDGQFGERYQMQVRSSPEYFLLLSPGGITFTRAHGRMRSYL